MFLLYVLTLASALNDCLFDAGAEVHADHTVRVCECFEIDPEGSCVDMWLARIGEGITLVVDVRGANYIWHPVGVR